MKKLYPQDFSLNITPVGDHLEIHIAPLDITVSTAPGKTSHSDALDVAQAAIEQHVMRDRATPYSTSGGRSISTRSHGRKSRRMSTL